MHASLGATLRAAGLVLHQGSFGFARSDRLGLELADRFFASRTVEGGHLAIEDFLHLFLDVTQVELIFGRALAFLFDRSQGLFLLCFLIARFFSFLACFLELALFLLLLDAKALGLSLSGGNLLLLGLLRCKLGRKLLSLDPLMLYLCLLSSDAFGFFFCRNALLLRLGLSNSEPFELLSLLTKSLLLFALGLFLQGCLALLLLDHSEACLLGFFLSCDPGLFLLSLLGPVLFLLLTGGL